MDHFAPPLSLTEDVTTLSQRPSHKPLHITPPAPPRTSCVSTARHDDNGIHPIAVPHPAATNRGHRGATFPRPSKTTKGNAFRTGVTHKALNDLCDALTNALSTFAASHCVAGVRECLECMTAADTATQPHMTAASLSDVLMGGLACAQRDDVAAWRDTTAALLHAMAEVTCTALAASRDIHVTQGLLSPSASFDRTVPTTPVSLQSTAAVGEEEDDGSFTINQHVVLMPIGHGTQGEVFLAMDTDKNKLRAIKAIRRPKGLKAAVVAVDGTETAPSPRGALAAARQSRQRQLEREIDVMKKCRHRHLVALHEVIDDPDHDTMYLVMQYVENGPLAQLRNDGTIAAAIPSAKLSVFAAQIVEGLQYLHRKGVIHRDIKPDNLLLGANDDVYLADFGTSELFGDGHSLRVDGTRGTLAFMAPELFDTPSSGDDAHATSTTTTTTTTTTAAAAGAARGEAVDVWALGMTLYVLLYGHLPWQSTGMRELGAEVRNGVIPIPPLSTMGSVSPSSLHPHQELVSLSSSSPRRDPISPPLLAFSAAPQPASVFGEPVATGFTGLMAIAAYPPAVGGPTRPRAGCDAHVMNHDPGSDTGPLILLFEPEDAQAPLRITAPALETSVHHHPRTRAMSQMNSSALGTLSMSVAGPIVDDLWVNLLRGMLTKDPESRMPLAQVAERVARIQKLSAAGMATSIVLPSCDGGEGEHVRVVIPRRQAGEF